MNRIKRGLRMGFNYFRKLHPADPNMPSVHQHAEIVQDYSGNEVAKEEAWVLSP
jgi:hypothetical protein